MRNVVTRSILAVMVFGASAFVASAQDTPSRYLVDEGSPPMSAIIGYSVIGENEAIAVDNDEGMFLIESDHRTKKIGLAGDGPCAVRQVSSFTVVQDTLFVLDNRQGRIIGYSISKGECVKEVIHPELAQTTSLSRVGGWFYLLVTKYTSSSASDRVLLYRLGAGSTLEPLNLTVGDLESDLLRMSLNFGRRTSQIRVKDDVLHFLLPLTHRVWRYDTQTGEVSSIMLPNDSPDISSYAESADFDEIREAMSQLETELDLFLLDDRIAVMSNYQRQWRLGLYTYSGEIIAKSEVSHHVDFESGGRFYSLKETGSEPNLYEILTVVPPSE